MIKELEARVAAAITATAAPVIVPQRKLLAEENDITSEVLPEVINITLRFTGLP